MPENSFILRKNKLVNFYLAHEMFLLLKIVHVLVCKIVSFSKSFYLQYNRKIDKVKLSFIYSKSSK